jgi:hypothetical protein
LSALEALPHRSNPLWRKLDLTPRRVTNRGKHKGASSPTDRHFIQTLRCNPP